MIDSLGITIDLDGYGEMVSKLVWINIDNVKKTEKQKPIILDIREIMVRTIIGDKGVLNVWNVNRIDVTAAMDLMVINIFKVNQN